MKIKELYEKWISTPGKPEPKYIVNPKLFYIQPIDAKCKPGTFGCDVGSHRGTLDGAKNFAASIKQSHTQRYKIVDPDGNVLDIV